MFRAGSKAFCGTLHIAPARCGLPVLNSWWRGNWWRLTPPAVPIASARGTDS